MIYPLCKTADIPEEGTLLLDFFGRSIHVYKVQGRLIAVANTCMHFGGPLDCKDGKFVCPWHGAEYDMATGQRLAAPAPANSKLMFLSTRVDGDTFNYVWGE